MWNRSRIISVRDAPVRHEPTILPLTAAFANKVIDIAHGTNNPVEHAALHRMLSRIAWLFEH